MARHKNRPRPVKQPKVAEEPTPEKRPRWVEPKVNGLPLAWRFSTNDPGGDWAWTSLQPPEKYQEVLEKLHEFETKNWREIVAGGSHSIELGRLAKKARDRLTVIKRDDLDELMSFRLTGKNRVWCVRDQNIMRLLWWDPDHTVCPSVKKHT